MTKIELQQLISKIKSEKVYARNRVEEAIEEESATNVGIWETIEVAYTDLLYKLNEILNEACR